MASIELRNSCGMMDDRGYLYDGIKVIYYLSTDNSHKWLFLAGKFNGTILLSFQYLPVWQD
jgi:hypothetical protein